MSDTSQNPYAAPTQTSIQPQSETDSLQKAPLVRNFKYQNATFCTIVCVLMGVNCLLDALSLGSSYMQLRLLQKPVINPAAAEMNDLREAAFGIANVGLYFITAIFFSIWTIRAHHNVRGFGVEGMTISPGWSIGYFFIPFINLVRPYQAMNELWRASKSPANWQQYTSAGIVPLWWLLWIGTNILGHITLRVSLAARDVPSLIQVTWLQIAVSVLGIVVAIVAWKMISVIQAMQNSWVEGGATQ